MIKRSIMVCAATFLISANSWAEQADIEPPTAALPALAPIIEPPIIPEQLRDGESIEPDVKIIQKQDRTIQEYRMNGRLYMIKITPTIGRPYFLMDTDGDGSLESRQTELGTGLRVPNWILLEW